jgi:hypothetical protein
MLIDDIRVFDKKDAKLMIYLIEDYLITECEDYQRQHMLELQLKLKMLLCDYEKV